jgi:dTDP-4-amino-4,6-dideoxy-D-galactose acyltransferase
MDECKERAICCLYYLAGAGDMQTIGLLEQHGFSLKDVRLTLIRKSLAAAPATADTCVRPAVPEDLPALRRIARISHHDSRFYADAGFPRERCDDLYDTWITKSCLEAYADAALVLDVDRCAQGYVTCSMVGPQRGQIGLLAVAPAARGKGASGHLIRASLAWFAQRGAVEAITVTQGRNISAARAYERCGFTIEAMQLWYHRWFM